MVTTDRPQCRLIGLGYQVHGERPDRGAIHVKPETEAASGGRAETLAADPGFVFGSSWGTALDEKVSSCNTQYMICEM